MHRKHVDDMSYVQKLLSSDFSEAFRLWKNGVRLYRSSADNGMVDLATPFFRTSAGTGNEYTLLISEILPSWRNYPKRNYCIICAGNRSSAEEYQEPGRAVYCVMRACEVLSVSYPRLPLLWQLILMWRRLFARRRPVSTIGYRPLSVNFSI